MKRAVQAAMAATVLATLSAVVALAQGAAGAPTPAIEPEYQQSWNDYLAIKAKAKPPRLPDMAGIWRRAAGAGGISSFDSDRGPRTDIRGYGLSSAQLTPKYQAAFDKKIANIKKEIEWDRLSACLPAGMPRWLTEPWQREFIVTPAVTWMIHEQISEVRRVYTDGKGHTPPGQVGPLWEGESIGFWDDDTLVVHTTHLKAGEYQRGQPDYSFKTSTLELIRKVNDNTIEDQITVYDPESLLKPYKAVFTYRKGNDANQRVNFGSCEEGNNAAKTPEGGTTFILPGESGYHDPTTYGIPEVAFDSLP